MLLSFFNLVCILVFLPSQIFFCCKKKAPPFGGTSLMIGQPDQAANVPNPVTFVTPKLAKLKAAALLITNADVFAVSSEPSP